MHVWGALEGRALSGSGAINRFTRIFFFDVCYYALWQGASVAIPMGPVALLLPKKPWLVPKFLLSLRTGGELEFQIGF